MANKRLTKAELQEKKDFAKILFTKENLTQKEIASRIGISQNTISKWAAEDRWEAHKKSTMLTREEQIRTMLGELEMLNLEIASSAKKYASKEQAYVRDTLVQNLQKLETDVSATEVYNVARKMIGFFRSTDLDKAKELTDFFDVYLKVILK